MSVDEFGVPREHWVLAGLSADDHPQYALVNGSRAFTGAAQLADGTAAAPALTFASDPDTGLYRSAADQIDATAGGQRGLTLTPNAVVAHKQARITDGTAADPGIVFNLEQNTGLYRDSAGLLAIATGGVRRAMIDANALRPGSDAAYDLGAGTFRWRDLYLSGRTLAGDGTAANPAYSFTADTNVGWYRGGADRVDFAANGFGIFYQSWKGTYGGIFPSDLDRYLGDSGAKWHSVWAVNGTIQTSDPREKADVADSDLGLDFVRELRPIRYRWRDGARTRYGLDAEQVREALDTVGADDFAGYVDPAVGAGRALEAGPPPELTENLGEDDDPDEVIRRWTAEREAERDAPKGLRYTDFIAPLIKAVQELADRIEALEGASA